MDGRRENGYLWGEVDMDKQKKATASLLAGTLSNIFVIGFGLAIYESRPLALVAGILAISLAIALVWRAEPGSQVSR